MSIKDCLTTARIAGEIDGEEAEAMSSLYDSLLRHYGDANIAKAEMVDRLMKEAQTKKRQALLSEDVRKKVEGFVLSFRDARGQQDPAKAMLYLMEHNGQVPMPEGMSSVQGRAKSILGITQAGMEDMLHNYRRAWVSGKTRNKASLENVVREAFGENTGDDAAKGFAKAWSDTAENLRQRFNAAGGAIGKLEGWGLPQSHNRRALLGAGKDTWKEFISKRLDIDKMRSPLNGKPMLPDELDKSLDYIFDNIASDGWKEREASAVRRGVGSLGNQRTESRFLKFKNADVWLEYDKEFGSGDPFATMMSHVRGMVEDIAAMEVLGPNPRATLTYLQNFVTKQAALKEATDPRAVFPGKTEYLGRSFDAGGSWLSTKTPRSYANEMIGLTDNMWDMFRGNTGVVNQRVADGFGVIRNLNVASKLGSASVSAVTDLGFQQMARRFAGLPVTKVYGDVLKAFTNTAGGKRDAVRAGLILDTATHTLHQEARWAGSMQGPEWSQWAADRVIASQGLQAWTQAGVHAFGLSFMGELASRATKNFAEMEPAFQRAFKRYGISEQDWDAIRLDENGAPKDVDFLKGADIAKQMSEAGRDSERIAERYLEMIIQETEYAVPQGTLQARARSYGGLQRGVFADELRRSMMQFKMFGLSVALLQSQRAASEFVMNGAARGAGYTAALMITTTLYGALALQLKDIKSGKDARPMDKEYFLKFLSSAALQGGGLGIYGDFLSADTNRFGSGLAETMAGPTIGGASDLMRLTAGNVAKAWRGEKTDGFGREAIRFVGNNIPGSSLWYINAAYQRMIINQLEYMVDPQGSTAYWAHQSQKQRKDYGSGYFWEPGQAKPRRGPLLIPQ